MATKLQAQALQVDRELQMFYAEFDGKVPQDLQWIFGANIATHRDRPTTATRQWLNTWKPIVEEAFKAITNHKGDPHHPDNNPYTTDWKQGSQY